MSEARATLAGGCFWCMEAVFKELDGVEEVTSGYAGGHVDNPTYSEVCTGDTGHAEAVQVVYDPDTITYRDLLEVFFDSHNPTTKDREGPDRGSQYRSAVFYHGEDQRETVTAVIDDLEAQYDDPIVTEVEPLETFYPAAAEHQDYFEKHPDDAYCRLHIVPKQEKLEEDHPDKLRDIT